MMTAAPIGATTSSATAVSKGREVIGMSVTLYNRQPERWRNDYPTGRNESMWNSFAAMSDVLFAHACDASIFRQPRAAPGQHVVTRGAFDRAAKFGAYMRCLKSAQLGNVESDRL